MTKVYQNDVGVKFYLNVGVDTAASTVQQIKVKRPDGTFATWTASIDGSSHISYVTVAGDLAQLGTYRIQSYMEWGSTSKHLGETVKFTVYAPYG